MQKREENPAKKAGLLPEKNKEKSSKSGGTDGGTEVPIKTLTY